MTCDDLLGDADAAGRESRGRDHPVSGPETGEVVSERLGVNLQSWAMKSPEKSESDRGSAAFGFRELTRIVELPGWGTYRFSIR